MQKLLILLTLCATMTLQGACSVHRFEIQQGNVVTPDVLSQIKPGLSKKQITSLLGTPLIIDPFHPDRWDYLYTTRSNEGEVTSRRLTLYFANDALLRIDEYPQPGL